MTRHANLDLATRAILFGAIGTAGQRCTTTRRVLLDQPIAEEMTKRLLHAYKQIRVGNPLEPSMQMGPLIDQAAAQTMLHAVETIGSQGGQVLCGGNALSGLGSPCYVEPTLVRASATMPILQEETFAPLLYLVEGQRPRRADHFAK